MSGRRTGSAARLAGLAAVLAFAAVSTAAAAGPGGQKVGRLRVQAQQLDTRAHKALLDLYALESQLGNARSRLAGLESRSAQLRARQEALTQQLVAARRTLAVSQRQLANHLRSLYEQESPDAFAVVLGAQSLDDALSKLDDLSRLAEQNLQVVSVTTAAQRRLGRLRTTLARQRRRLDEALAAARAAERQLEGARADRLAFVGRLRSEQQLKETQIRGIVATAHAVEVKSQQIQSSATPTPASFQPAPPPGAATTAPAASSGQRTLVVSATGYSLPGHTASGLPVGWGIVAVDPSVIPLGTRMTVPGYGEAVAADVGSAVRGADIDLWFPTLAQARAWGRRTVTITLH